MPGSWITNRQEEIYMQSRNLGTTQKVSAVRSGISERSGREIEKGRRKDPRSMLKSIRTRNDPLAEVWGKELVPMLEQMPMLQPITLLEHMQERYLDEIGNPIYSDKILRTLQRRVKEWKAVHGPKREVMFRQIHYPGQMGLSDFTKLKRVTITIQGKPLSHLLYHFRLIFSHWSHLKVVLGGESYTALTEGLQEALWRLGGSPKEHRTDSLSAAFKNLSRDEKKDVTERYDQFCQHYQMKATRNNLSVKHENGGVESPHGHLKRRIEQALILRRSNDFEAIESYQAFIDEITNQHNRRNAQAIQVERKELQKLPKYKGTDYTDVVATVTSSATINVCRVIYTVPSQLVGETLRVRLYHDRMCCYLGTRQVHQLTRKYSNDKLTRVRQIDYRHLIHSLVKKPQAFRYSQLRDDILPTDGYRKIWQCVDKQMPPRKACKFIVGLLHLSSKNDSEKELEEQVLEDIAQSRQLSLAKYQAKFIPMQIDMGDVQQHNLSSYDNLIPEVSHA